MWEGKGQLEAAGARWNARRSRLVEEENWVYSVDMRRLSKARPLNSSSAHLGRVAAGDSAQLAKEPACPPHCTGDRHLKVMRESGERSEAKTSRGEHTLPSTLSLDDTRLRKGLTAKPTVELADCGAGFGVCALFSTGGKGTWT